jgi:hypothetical protein
MSSAILYLAIIAIWACVLVPRWIHKPHRILPEPEKLFGLQYSAAPGAPDAETGEMAGDGWDDRGDSTEVLPGVAGQGTALDHGAAPQNGVPAEQGVAWHRITERRTYHATGPAPGSRPVSPAQPGPDRSRVVQARRRLLTMLVTLMIAALAATAAKLSPGWILVPPGGMLGVYLLLLREATHADAEQAQWQAQELAAEAAARAETARQRARRAWEASQPQPTAEIIDISARVTDQLYDQHAGSTDQLYDQYADAAVRAVGD